jgi:Tfp pilus assembly protein PilO
LNWNLNALFEGNWSQIGSWSKKAQIGLWIGAWGIAFGLGYQGSILPLQQHLQRAQEEHHALLDKQQALESLGNIKKVPALVVLLLPSELPSQLALFASLAEKHGVVVKKLKMQPDRIEEALHIQPLDMALIGSFSALLAFMADWLATEPVSTFHSLQLTREVDKILLTGVMQWYFLPA